MDDNKFKGWKESVMVKSLIAIFKPLLMNIILPFAMLCLFTMFVAYIITSIANFF